MADDQAAINDLLEAIRPELMRICAREAYRRQPRGNDSSQQDFAQEASVRIAGSIKTFHYARPGSFSRWVNSIVRNLLKDYLRMQRAQKRNARVHHLPDTTQAAGTARAPGRKPGTTPDQALLREDMRERVERAMEGMPETAREVLIPYVQRWYESNGEVDLGDLAKDLGLGKDALRKRIDRYLLRLGERLRAVGGGSSIG